MLLSSLSLILAVQLFLLSFSTLWPDKFWGWPVLVLAIGQAVIAFLQFRARFNMLDVDVTGVAPSTNTSLASYLRITNRGPRAAPAKIEIFQSATGEQLGGFETPVLPLRATLQLSASQIEQSIGRNPNVGESYRVHVKAQFEGAVEHFHIGAGQNVANIGGVVPRRRRLD